MREVRPGPIKEDCILIASDAQADSAPSGGYLWTDPRVNNCEGAFGTMPEELLALWGFPLEARVAGVIE